MKEPNKIIQEVLIRDVREIGIMMILKQTMSLVAAIAYSITLSSCQSNMTFSDSHLTVDGIEMKLGKPFEEGLLYDELPCKTYSLEVKGHELSVVVLYRGDRAIVMQYLTPLKHSMSIEERFVSRENMRKGAEHLEFPETVAQEILEAMFKGQKLEELGSSGNQWITQRGKYKITLGKKEGKLTVTSIGDMAYIDQLNSKQEREQDSSADAD